MVTLCDLTYDLDLGFPRINFENSYILGITSDITSVYDKKILGVASHSWGDMRNVGIFAVGILVSLMIHQFCWRLLYTSINQSSQL